MSASMWVSSARVNSLENPTLHKGQHSGQTASVSHQRRRLHQRCHLERVDAKLYTMTLRHHNDTSCTLQVSKVVLGRYLLLYGQTCEKLR